MIIEFPYLSNPGHHLTKNSCFLILKKKQKQRKLDKSQLPDGKQVEQMNIPFYGKISLT